jgi:hypothetical protein
VWWIMGMLSSCLLWGCRAGGQWEGSNDDGTSMTPVTGDGNGEGEVMGCDHFRMGEGEGEAALRCRRRTTQ